MDWVPMAFYGDAFTVLPGATGYVILYPLPDYALGDQEFLVEDEDETGMFLERIVGDIYVSTSILTGQEAVAWQLMPLGADYEAAVILQPYTTDWTPDDSEWANLRWWDRRCVAHATQGYYWPESIDIPHWTHVDINPRQMMGAKRNLWPVLVVYNDSPDSNVLVKHNLRALYK